MRVVVEILTGTLFYIQVKEDGTIADLKKAIEVQEKLPCDRLILMINGNSSSMMNGEDETPLMEYGVHDGSHVYLFFGPPLEDSTHFLLCPPDSTWSQASPLIGPLYQQCD